ncbi:MAG TPA: MYXO-CTERM sorting domain-containing protein, partial [Nannocystis sp.]
PCATTRERAGSPARPRFRRPPASSPGASLGYPRPVLRLAVVLATFLIPLGARADLIADGYKTVKLSIHVDAVLPADKALVLANTFEGGTVLTPGVEQDISWHPRRGDMQLRVVPADKVEELRAAAQNRDDDTSKPILDAAFACGPSFPGERIIVDTSPAVKVRWTFRASVAGDACTADLVRKEFLDADGKVVDPPSDPADLGPKSAPLADPPRPAAPTKTADTPAAPASPGGCTCRTDDEPTRGLAWLALTLLVWRRRR